MDLEPPGYRTSGPLAESDARTSHGKLSLPTARSPWEATVRLHTLVIGQGLLVAGPAGGHPLLDQRHHRGVGQRRDVADLAVLGHVAQQAAHDLAGPGLRELLDDHDLARLGDRPDLLGDVCAQL